MNEKHFDSNRSLWDRMTPIHERSAFYDVAAFKAGESSLRPVEVSEVGAVTGKDLLHLQCHFGMDTLSWVRRGARATGVDFSPRAIALARSLSLETGVAATFVQANIYELPDALAGKFDIVYTSYGVLCWLPDLARWAEIIALYLKPGGTFYLIEFHPLALMLDDAGERLQYPYFHTPEPLAIEGTGDYADPAVDLPHISYEWFHPLSDVINVLIRAGLHLEFVHEFPYSSFQCFPFLEEAEPGKSYIKNATVGPPLMFSIRATR